MKEQCPLDITPAKANMQKETESLYDPVSSLILKTLSERIGITNTVGIRMNYNGLKASFIAPHTGHIQSSGRSSNAVPGAIPLSGSPSSGSYS
jgi:hypothetical protein